MAREDTDPSRMVLEDIDLWTRVRVDKDLLKMVREDTTPK
jgi:hypothetical protein